MGFFLDSFADKKLFCLTSTLFVISPDDIHCHIQYDNDNTVLIRISQGGKIDVKKIFERLLSVNEEMVGRGPGKVE